MTNSRYDPFTPGRYPVGVRHLRLRDAARDREFPAEIRVPAKSGPYPLVVYSHSSGGNRQSATFLNTHLASHGYAVAALDHSELVAPELARTESASTEQRAARIAAIVAARVPDVRFLIDYVAAQPEFDVNRTGLVGHSFGGWTVLAAANADARVAGVVAHAPGGATAPQPGVLPLTLSFDASRTVPTLYLAAELDVPIPPAAVRDVFDRTPWPKQMVTLQRADHQHFVDDVEGTHDAVRIASLPDEAAWMVAATRPMTELCSGVQAHAFVRALTLAHLDATLRANPDAAEFLADGLGDRLAAHGVAAVVADS
ncbi:MAG TPA: dienelactone hydrolase family protein [Micromonosporaceae bacterium]|jgi:dienelactone hydrolase